MPLEAIGGVGNAGGSPPNAAKNLNSGLAGGCLGQPRRQKLIFTTPPMHFGPPKGEEDAVGGR